jgi:endonuclease/exonuclease/phosphatase family metal-dependent hydrolase
MTLRVLSWNCRRASRAHELWRYVAEISPDIAVLQEVTHLPHQILDAYDTRSATPTTKSGGPQRFQSMVLARGSIGEAISLHSEFEWVNHELRHFAANLLAYRVTVENFAPLILVGVYAPAWPVARDRLSGHDVGAVKLSQNPDVWVGDLLVAALRHRSVDGPEWIVAGDFNSCETFDSWKGGPRGNREWLDRMAALGFTECLRHSQGALTPTFRKPGASAPRSQIDHMFVTRGLAARLAGCATGDQERVYGLQLSDHLPIVADFSGIDATLH